DDLREFISIEQVKHQPGGADFEERSRGEDIAVAMDQMQAPILPGVGQRFIACVDDGAIVLHPFEEIVLDIIRPLRDLKQCRLLALNHFTAKTRGRIDPTRPAPVKSTRSVRKASNESTLAS